MAKDTKTNDPQAFGDVAPNLGEAPSPVPAQETAQAPADNNEIPLPRIDVGEVQPRPDLTPRTVVMEPTPPVPERQAPTESTGIVVSVPPGGLVELARLLYGDPSRAAEIANLNKDKIINPDAIIVGTAVRVNSK